MAIDRKQIKCHFCREVIPMELVRTRSVARDCSGWQLIRGGVKRQTVGIKLGPRYAHNVCVEAAFMKQKALAGQQEMWPDV
jgi:hypothetical protein